MAEAEERPSKIRKLNAEENDGSKILHVSKERAESGAQDEVKSHSQEEEDDEDSEVEYFEAADMQGPSTPIESANLLRTEDSSEPSKPLSKNQQKKLRKQAEWEAGKEWRKAKKKEKAKAKKLRRKEGLASSMHDSLPKPKNLPAEEAPAASSRPGPKRPILTPITLAIDCSFDDLMTDKERISLGAQLTRSYSDNRSAPFKGHVVVSSWGGKLKERFETVLANTHLGWRDVRFFEEDYVEAAEQMHSVMHSKEGGKLAGALAEVKGDDGESKAAEEGLENEDGSHREVIEPSSADVNGNTEQPSTEQQSPQQAQPDTSSQPASEPASGPAQIPDSVSQAQPPTTEPSIVYLTSDSPHTLTTLSPYTTYIIGGLVDKNRYKGICYKRARERGIPTAKLPIGEYMIMQSRTVLATNHVVEIMIRYLEDGDWGKAFLRVIPKRKEARLRGKKGRDGEDAENGDENGGNAEEDAEAEEDASHVDNVDDDDEDNNHEIPGREIGAAE